MKLFVGPIQTWNGPKCYDKQRRELGRQINRLISIQSALGQTSQGQREDWKRVGELADQAKRLQRSIATALSITKQDL